MSLKLESCLHCISLANFSDPRISNQSIAISHCIKRIRELLQHLSYSRFVKRKRHYVVKCSGYVVLVVCRRIRTADLCNVKADWPHQDTRGHL